MGRIALLLALVAATTLLAAGVAFTQVPGGGYSDRYIVVFENDVNIPSQVANGIARRQNAEVGFVYGHALKGFSARIPDKALAAVRANPRVAYVERDGTVRAVAQTLPWGINRIDADRSSTRAGNGSGRVSGVNVYVVDTGVDASHADLNVVGHVNFRGDGKNTDCSGHGTHVAGTMAAKDNKAGVVGVAPGAPLIGVKVLDCFGDGSASTIIKGIDWVTANAQKPAIANISISGPANDAIDDAVRSSARSGVFYSVAAGNDDNDADYIGEDACTVSPARAGAGKNNGIVTTAATGKSNDETPGSNYGRCVDLWAPGARILSTYKGGGTIRMSGTSMAAPHVGGTGALYLSSHAKATPTRVEEVLKADSVRTGEVSKEDGRPIRLVYAGGY